MKSKLIFIFFVSLWLVISAEDPDYNSQDYDEPIPPPRPIGICGTGLSVDEYVDKILDGVRSAIPDPLDLPDAGSRIELHDGKLFGLSTLHRSGHSSVDCSKDIMKISTFLRTDFLLANYNWKYKTFLFNIDGFLNITSNDFEAFIQMLRYTENGEDRAELTKFDVTKLEKLEVKTTGVGPVTWLLSKISTLVSPLFRSHLEDALENALKIIINEKLRSN